MADKNGGQAAGQPAQDIEILYEDNHLLGVVKPVNVPVQEDATGDPDLLTLLKEDIKRRYDKPGNVFMGLVHRLDRPVGGAMIFAKTSKAASRLSENVRNRSFRKVYLTVVHGELPAPSGRLRNFLLKNAKTNTVTVVRQGMQDAKEAVLDYKLSIAEAQAQPRFHHQLLPDNVIEYEAGKYPDSVIADLAGRGWIMKAGVGGGLNIEAVQVVGDTPVPVTDPRSPSGQGQGRRQQRSLNWWQGHAGRSGWAKSPPCDRPCRVPGSSRCRSAAPCGRKASGRSSHASPPRRGL
ncbi:Ribosomal large subunit pseudouridine synthase C [compost metagenome]